MILWGFTAGVITRLFDYLGWATPGSSAVEDYEVRDLPPYMLQGVTRNPTRTLRPPDRQER